MSDAERVTPTEIRKQQGAALHLGWKDGHASTFPALYLRGRCPCASCVDEDTGRRRVDERQVDAAVGMRAARLVGNYAIQIDWSDGHATGLYSFAYLRSICPCEICRTA